jgi:hypothetical protein
VFVSLRFFLRKFVSSVVLARPGVSVTDPLFWLFVFFSVLDDVVGGLC